jgi:outer membrane lipoprotein-sorting protein
MSDLGHSCDEWAEAVSLAAAGCLPPEEQRQVREHIASCPACRERFHQLAALCDALAASRLPGDDAAPALVARAMAAIVSDAPDRSVLPKAEGRILPDPDVSPFRRMRKMKSLVKMALAASLLAAVGIVVACVLVGGNSNLAFAAVADALERLHSATFDMTMEMKDPMTGKKMPPGKWKASFLAPGSQRMEFSQGSSTSVMIFDYQTSQAVVLMAEPKIAFVMDTKKMAEEMKKSGRPQQDMFEMVRQLVREGRSSGFDNVEPLGKKDLDGRTVVGFRTRMNNMTDMTLWADPQSARLVRVELAVPDYEGHGVMDNFRYDVDLDASLFNTEPPAGYTVQKLDIPMPVEDDLVRTLRIIAEYNKGAFPKAIGMNKEFMQAVAAAAKPEMDKIEPEMKKLEAKYGKNSPEVMKAAMPVMLKFNQKFQQGLMFYMTLTPKNDPHYVGGGVKLGTPDRPIFWYKPTGANKYRVMYADLSVREADAPPQAPNAQPLPEAAGAKQ